MAAHSGQVPLLQGVKVLSRSIFFFAIASPPESCDPAENANNSEIYSRLRHGRGDTDLPALQLMMNYQRTFLLFRRLPRTQLEADQNSAGDEAVWNGRKYAAMIIVGAGLAVAAATPASA
jgi:hypothetical protein